MQRFSCARQLAAAAAALLLTALPATAQIGVPASRARAFQPRVGIGYLANVPNQFVGGSAHVLLDVFGGVGLYVDAKFDPESPEDSEGFIDSLTVAEVEENFNDQFFSEEGSWTSFNVAVMKALGPQFVVYAGAGWADAKQYVEFLDSDRDLGESGFYWVRDEENSGGEVNVMGGAMFQLTSNIAFQVGAESAPGGFTVGASYLIPLGGRRR
ncbi:MAG TPA: hypothetical protein VFR37_11940 [Longimicrobium sp.]|nr:hypothetical protein [Longimicrobium sp.]